MGDIMGATTWTYPSDSLSFNELQTIILAYRKGTVATYEAFLAEVKTFKNQEIPEIGENWPAEGYFLPTSNVFIDSVKMLVSNSTLEGVLKQ